MGRRTSVSAESLNPTVSSTDNWTPPFHKKSPEQLERLKTALLSNLLFNKLDDEQSSQVLGALVEKSIPAKDIKVCGPYVLTSCPLESSPNCQNETIS
jgi:cAMP-dependent protein kinase regulator